MAIDAEAYAGSLASTASTRRPLDAVAATPSGRLAFTTDGAGRAARNVWTSAAHKAYYGNFYGSYLLHDVYSAATSRVKIHCVWW